MEEHMTDLNILAKKYREQIESLQNHLDEAKRKFTVVSDAIELLKKEGVFDQEKLFETPNVLSDQYKDKSMTEAVEDILKSNQPEKLSVDVIYSELLKHGFKSESQNLQRDVYSRLNRMEKSGKSISTKRGKGKKKKYFLPKKEEEIKDPVST